MVEGMARAAGVDAADGGGRRGTRALGAFICVGLALIGASGSVGS